MQLCLDLPERLPNISLQTWNKVSKQKLKTNGLNYPVENAKWKLNTIKTTESSKFAKAFKKYISSIN